MKNGQEIEVLLIAAIIVVRGYKSKSWTGFSNAATGRDKLISAITNGSSQQGINLASNLYGKQAAKGYQAQSKAAGNSLGSNLKYSLGL